MAPRPPVAVVPGVLWRQTAFALWAVGFAASIPLALLFFLLVLAREGWRRSLLVSVGGWLFLYGLFVQILGVPL